MKKRFILITALIALLLLFLVGCDFDSGSGSAGNNDEPIDYSKISVMVTTDVGAKVTSKNPVTIDAGGTATFDIELGNTYTVSSVSHGTYEDGVLTVEGLTKNTVIDFITLDLGYDTTSYHKVFFNAEEGDESSFLSGASVKMGTEITVKANATYRAFVGWSIGSYTTDQKKLISTDREFTFRLSPDIAKGEVVKLYANYIDADFYYYDLNGGSYTDNTLTTFSSENKYWQVELVGERVKVTVSDTYLDAVESVCLFFDDGMFYREGYVLCEYNTEPDGSGEGYSLGSKYYIDPTRDEVPVLYLIWKRADNAVNFVYEEYNVKNPTTAAKAPHWKENGIKITFYAGNLKTVAIPEMIDGKYVVAIGEGAFSAKAVETLVLSKYIHTIEDGAFKNCRSLNTIYFPDSIYYMENEAFDDITFSALDHLYVNATMAPRQSNTDAGAYSVKLSRLLASQDQNRIIMIAGSSAYQGIGSEYMEALLGGEYRFINFGTTRTTNGMIYLEAMQALAHEGDIILYAPENSTYMMGENELYWKTLRDMESMYNLYRYIDISEYTNVFSAFSDYNKRYRYNNNPRRPEEFFEVITVKGSVNEYGDYQNAKRVSLVDSYVDAYFITMNEMYKSKYDVNWDDVAGQIANKDYTDPNNKTWESIISERLRTNMNRAIGLAKSSGAKVYFSFSPVDADKLVPEAQNHAWLLAYDRMIAESFEFDGVLGRSADYVYAHEYFYDCAFHLNDVGRTYRTYQVYRDLCTLLRLNAVGFTSVGTDFEGCIFEEGSEYGEPVTTPSYLN